MALIFLFLLIVSAVAARIFLWLLGRVAPDWGAVRTVLISSAILPVALWLLAFGVDVYGAVSHRQHPSEPFMGGLSIFAILPLLPCFMVGCLVTAIALALRRQALTGRPHQGPGVDTSLR